MKTRFGEMKWNAFYLTAAALMVFAAGCLADEPDYYSMVEAGKNSEIRHDSLFLGYYFGMTRDKFHEYSWELNRQQKITGLTKIEYMFDDLPHRATKVFFPDFHQEKISAMPVTVSYNAWAPWNQDHSADSLVLDLVDYYEEIFQTEFRKVYLPKQEQTGWLSVDGNRAIEIYKVSEMIVGVDFTDLSVVL